MENDKKYKKRAKGSKDSELNLEWRPAGILQSIVNRKGSSLRKK